MARRIVVLGAKREPKMETTCPAISIHADDAAALVAAQMLRVEIAKRGASLSDALTLTFESEYLRVLAVEMGLRSADGSFEVTERAFQRVRNVVGARVIEEFEVPTPIPFE